MSNSFYFAHQENPTCYNIAKQLVQLGFSVATTTEDAVFTDEHLVLDKKACETLEHKHRLVEFLQDEPFIPESYYIDDHNFSEVLNQLTEEYYLSTQDKLIEERDDIFWLLKPSLMNNGSGILLFNNISKLWDHYTMGKRIGGPHVLQRYIHEPLLIKGRKHTLRFFVVVVPHRGVFVYKKGVFNVSHQVYSTEDLTTVGAHLTNRHLNGAFSNARQLSTQKYPFYKEVFPDCCNVITTTFTKLKKNYPHFLDKKSKRLSLFAFDFLLDNNKKLWLLEVNHGPDFPTSQAHELNEPFLNAFWPALTENFVLPIIGKSKPLNQNLFKKLVKPSNWWSRLIG